MRACFSVLLLQPAAVAVVATIVVKNVFCFFIFFSIKTCFFNFFILCMSFISKMFILYGLGPKNHRIMLICELIFSE